MDEFGLIARYFAPIAARDPCALGLRDDAAVIDVTPGQRLVATTDAIVAGIHFLADDPPGDIARKLMRVNLSDIAAMGAVPRAVLVALVLPRGTRDDWLAGFAAGLAEDCAAFGVALAGGDTVATDGPLTLSLTALGEADRVLTRAGAKEGDDVYVSGTIGDAMLGLRLLQGRLAGVVGRPRDFLIGRYRVPQPRIALGRALVGLASACMDVSDGLIGDLGHICEASGVGARITSAAVPTSPAAARALTIDPALRGAMLGGGDDYELLFTAPPAARERIAALAAGVSTARIGTIVAGRGVEVTDAVSLGLTIASPGFTHF